MGLSGKVADIQLMEGKASVQRIPDIYRKWATFRIGSNADPGGGLCWQYLRPSCPTRQLGTSVITVYSPHYRHHR